MKIAIVSPSPVPFTIGGAEKLWMGLFEYINKNTNHQCELIKVPTIEKDFWSLIDSYYKFYNMDLSHFDMIISGKYPAWMVQHKNHHVYMLHCLRGLYDTYHFTNLPTNFQSKHPKVADVLNTIENNDSLDIFLEKIYNLKDDNTIPPETFNFPGAFIRKIIHYFDKKALLNAKRISAISQTVINRKDYFPNNTNITKIYPPSTLENFKNLSYDYFFTVSRLDNAKRIENIVKAYLQTNSKIPLKIAGTGPLENKLKDLAKNDNRIEFLGFISDKELIDLYAKAYSVIFIPYDEDYGLITIEAMMSEKSVITYSDSGGVTEFVEHFNTGLISKPDINLLAKNIEYLANNKNLAIQMGKKANEKVKNITWENVTKSLLNYENNNIKEITVLTTYSVYPPRGGGQNRIYYLYKELAKYFKVNLLCISDGNISLQTEQIAPNFYEIRVPKSSEFTKKENQMSKKAEIPVTDIAMLYYYNDLPQYIEEFKKLDKTSDIIVIAQHYCFNLYKQYSKKSVIYDSQNIEYTLKKQMLKDNQYTKSLLNKVYKAEQEAIENSILTIVCSQEDEKGFKEIYGISNKDYILVPNGVDLSSVPYVPKQKRLEIKNKLKIEDKIITFIGSWHQPNIDAVYEIFKIAKKLPTYKFLIIGSVGLYFENIDKPQNVGFTGVVDDKEKELFLTITDIAINPMLTGSGTNLKMLDYMANGIPVISTKIGARGLNIPKDYIVICNIDEFDKYIENIDLYVDTKKSREFVEQNYSWKVIKNNYLKKLFKLKGKQ